jgi:hypothetical protein
MKYKKFICPICEKEHQTKILYSLVVCDQCINVYGIKNELGDSLHYYVDENEDIHTSSSGFYTTNRECFVNNVECYLLYTYGVVAVVATLLIPENKKN